MGLDGVVFFSILYVQGGPIVQIVTDFLTNHLQLDSGKFKVNFNAT